MPIPEPFVSDYRIATDREIRSWSFGQVSKPRAPNSALLDDHIGTLNDQRIFGSVIDLRCACGKYDGSQNKGMICDRCGVKVATTEERRDRFGHIDFRARRIAHPFDSSAKMGCFPVIAAVYLESQSGTGLCALYERMLADPASLPSLVDYLTPTASNSIRWNAKDSHIFTRGMGLVQKNAT